MTRVATIFQPRRTASSATVSRSSATEPPDARGIFPADVGELEFTRNETFLRSLSLSLPLSSESSLRDTRTLGIFQDVALSPLVSTYTTYHGGLAEGHRGADTHGRRGRARPTGRGSERPDERREDRYPARLRNRDGASPGGGGRGEAAERSRRGSYTHVRSVF